jgi:hypothetical protein
MPSGPRSQRLLAWYFAAAGSTPMFASPANMITLVKSIVFFNGGATPCRLLVYLHYNGPVTIISTVETLASGASFHWEGWVVLNPGEGISANCDLAGPTIGISGAVLIGTPPATPAELERPLRYADEPATTPTAGATPSPLSPTRTRRGRVNKV